jgi:hypothetical protein
MALSLWLTLCIAFSSSLSAQVDINPGFVDFGQLEIEESDTQSIYVHNESLDNIAIEDISLFGHSDININNYCPYVLTPGTECEIEVISDCREIGLIDSAIEIEFKDLWPETVFIEVECVPSW